MDPNAADGTEKDHQAHHAVCIHTRLMNACTAGDAARVELLLGAGAAVEARTWAGRTALGYACEFGRLEVVRLLVERGGANVNARAGWCGGTALVVACGGGHLEIARLLVQLGADLLATNHDGGTALLQALRNNHMETASWLVEQALGESNRTGELNRTNFLRRCLIVDDLFGDGVVVSGMGGSGRQGPAYSQRAAAQENMRLKLKALRPASDLRRTRAQSATRGIAAAAAAEASSAAAAAHTRALCAEYASAAAAVACAAASAEARAAAATARAAAASRKARAAVLALTRAKPRAERTAAELAAIKRLPLSAFRMCVRPPPLAYTTLPTAHFFFTPRAHASTFFSHAPLPRRLRNKGAITCKGEVLMAVALSAEEEQQVASAELLGLLHKLGLLKYGA